MQATFSMHTAQIYLHRPLLVLQFSKMHVIAADLTFGEAQWEEATWDLLAESKAKLETPT